MPKKLKLFTDSHRVTCIPYSRQNLDKVCDKYGLSFRLKKARFAMLWKVGSQRNDKVIADSKMITEDEFDELISGFPDIKKFAGKKRYRITKSWTWNTVCTEARQHFPYAFKTFRDIIAIPEKDLNFEIFRNFFWDKYNIFIAVAFNKFSEVSKKENSIFVRPEIGFTPRVTYYRKYRGKESHRSEWLGIKGRLVVSIGRAMYKAVLVAFDLCNQYIVNGQRWDKVKHPPSRRYDAYNHDLR